MSIAKITRIWTKTNKKKCFCDPVNSEFAKLHSHKYEWKLHCYS